MAGGPIFPHSEFSNNTLRVYPNIHSGAGANSKYDEGWGVEASLSIDSPLRLRFAMPPVLPTGTCKLRLLALANATTGNAKVNPKWVSVAAEEDPSSATPVAEGTQTVSWGAGDNDQYKELKVTLDADTVVASEVIVMDILFETSSWTLAAISTWIPMIIWE